MATKEDWERLRRPFPPEQIEKVQKFKNGPALDYIGHATITERLQECDPEWSIDFAYFNENGTPVIDHQNGLAYFKMTVFGVTRLCIGDTGGKPLHGNGHKEMMGDAIRNGAMRFGVGTYLWSKSEEAEMKKRNPAWQDTLDALESAEHVEAQMNQWSQQNKVNEEIAKYARARIAELRKGQVNG